MFGVRKIEKVVADELYAAQRDALDAAGVVEQAQHALDVAAARLTMLNNRVMRLQMHGDTEIAPFGGTSEEKAPRTWAHGKDATVRRG
jgi:hypothetical protein